MATTLLSIAATLTAAAVILISLLLSKVIKIIRCIHSSRRKRRCKEEEEKKEDNNNCGSTKDDTSVLQHCRRSTSTRTSSIKTVIFLGSGGHTTEMIQLIQQLDTTVYAPIIYIVGGSDVTSIPRLQRYISSLKNEGEMNKMSQYNRRRWEGRYPKDINDDENILTTTTTEDPTITASAQVYTLPRAREVHQSYLSSIFTTLYSTYKTLQLLYTLRPNLILTNGPGTCVPLVYCAFVLRLWFSLMNDDTTLDNRLSSTPSNNNNKRSSSHLLYRTIFIESICRVKTLSLSGKLVYPIVDSFMVHWPNLMERYGMVENCDVFVSSPTSTSNEHDD